MAPLELKGETNKQKNQFFCSTNLDKKLFCFESCISVTVV